MKQGLVELAASLLRMWVAVLACVHLGTRFVLVEVLVVASQPPLVVVVVWPQQVRELEDPDSLEAVVEGQGLSLVYYSA